MNNNVQHQIPFSGSSFKTFVTDGFYWVMNGTHYCQITFVQSIVSPQWKVNKSNSRFIFISGHGFETQSCYNINNEPCAMQVHVTLARTRNVGHWVHNRSQIIDPMSPESATAIGRNSSQSIDVATHSTDGDTLQHLGQSARRIRDGSTRKLLLLAGCTRDWTEDKRRR